MTGIITRGDRQYRYTLTPGSHAGELRIQCVRTGWIKLVTVRLPPGTSWSDAFISDQARRILEDAYANRPG